MEGNGSKTILGIIGLLFVIGMGIGGYYLGLYLDKQAGEKQAETLKNINRQYINNELGIKFTYPGNWKQPSKNEIDGATVITVEGPSGSNFLYSYKQDGEGDTLVCNDKVPDGDNTGIQKCTFVASSSLSFARISRNLADSGTNWYIAEVGDEQNPGSYIYRSFDSFSYYVRDPRDIEVLDKIMKSVVRTK